ncbi:MAG TPA: hypothetical protein VGL77_20250 [Armatimonadota bacterium]
MKTDFTNAVLDGCRIYGISAWDVILDGAQQSNMIVTPLGEPEVVVDNLEIAQFIYMLLTNAKLRDTISMISRKAVLILGNFARLDILNDIRSILRDRGYCPILFDFSEPKERNTTEVVSILARLSRFIIADISEPRCVPHELAWNVPQLHSVPVLPIIEDDGRPYFMARDLDAYPWFMKLYRYRDSASLLSEFDSQIIQPAEEKAQSLISDRIEREASDWK